MRDQIRTSLESTLQSVELDERFKQFEEKLFKKKKRPEATAAQRFLIMYYTKALDPIIQNQQISQNTKDKQVAAILDIDPDNAKKYLRELGNKNKPLLHTKKNYEFLVSFFVHPGQEIILEQTETILTKILAYRETL